jgi:hypothetical protein
VIKDPRSYRERAEREEREALERMGIEDSIAIGEALLTSELMDLAEFPDDDHPMSLAIALGIAGPPPGPAPSSVSRLGRSAGYAEQAAAASPG